MRPFRIPICAFALTLLLCSSILLTSRKSVSHALQSGTAHGFVASESPAIFDPSIARVVRARVLLKYKKRNASVIRKVRITCSPAGILIPPAGDIDVPASGISPIFTLEVRDPLASKRIVTIKAEFVNSNKPIVSKDVTVFRSDTFKLRPQPFRVPTGVVIGSVSIVSPTIINEPINGTISLTQSPPPVSLTLRESGTDYVSPDSEVNIYDGKQLILTWRSSATSSTSTTFDAFFNRDFSLMTESPTVTALPQPVEDPLDP